MKKAFYIVLIATLFSLFSLAAQEYSVRTVSGSVYVESSPGEWVKVTTGSSLSPLSRINVGLNSSLKIIGEEGEEFSLNSMQKGVLKDLLKKSPIILGGSLTEGSLDTDTDRDRTNISTASTRADDAQEEMDWMEEE